MTVAPAPVLILRRSEVAALMNPAAYLAAAEAAFRSYANGDASVPMPMHIPVQNGGFHVKGALVILDRAYVAVKLNGNFPDNSTRNGLPTIQGVVLLCDADDGSLLAVIDSIEITLRRTAAASALAARYLAREDASSIAICGCGDQGRAQLTALAEVVALRRVKVWDIDIERAREFAREMHEVLGLEVTTEPTLGDATWRSGIVVTATSAQTPFLTPECVSPGTFVAAIGADSPHKNELTAELLAGSKIVVDVLACFTSEQGNAIRITPVREAALPGWLDAHPESREWISVMGFKGEPGTFAFLAGDNGRPSGLIASPTEGGSVWAFAGLPMALPEGTYVLESVADDSSPTDLALGWALGSYAFTQYKKPKRLPAKLVWPAKADRNEIERIAEAVCLARDLI